MSSYLPPIETLPIFNPIDYPSNEVDSTIETLFYKKSGGTISGQVNLTPKMMFLNTNSVLEATEGNRIDIPADTTLYIIDNLDLVGKRLNMLGNVSIIGNSSEVTSLTSTGLPSGQSLITSAFTLPIRNITFGCPIDTNVFNLSSDNTNGIDFFAVNFGSVGLSCGSLGTISNYSNVIITESSVLNAYNGIIFSGTIATIGINNSLFSTLTLASGSKHIQFTNCTVTRRFRANVSSFITVSGNTSLSVEGTTTFPDESFILNIVNFGGGGTYLFGLTPESNTVLITNTIGIENSTKVGYVTFSGNSTSTTISDTNTYYKVAGTTLLSSFSRKFDQNETVNRLRFTGAIVQNFLVSVSLTLTSGNNNEIGITLYKNGTTQLDESSITTSAGGRFENVKYQCIVQLASNDYLELFVENRTAITNITVINLSFIVSVI